MQSRTILTVNVNHVFRRNVDRIVPRHIPDVAGMVLQNPVVCRVAPTVIRDSIDTGVIFKPAQFSGNAIRLDQLQVQFHTVADFGIRCQHGKRFAILTAGHSHRPEFRSKTNGIRPAHECRFHSVVERLVCGKHLQSRPRADGVVCEHLHQSSGVGIVGNFVARAHPQRPADFRRSLHVRRQMIRRRPVTPVVPRRLRRIKPGADKLLRRGSAPKNGFESVEHRWILTPLNGTIWLSSGRKSGILPPFSTRDIHLPQSDRQGNAARPSVRPLLQTSVPRHSAGSPLPVLSLLA